MKQLSKIVIFGLIVMFACTTENERPPISESKLVDILVDIHLAEAAIQEMSGFVQQDSVGKIYYDQIFRIHQVTQEDFNKTIYLMRMDPIRMEKVYKKVLEKTDKDLESLY
ncbi:MAG: DUF4296 domain-containing protein [Saprospiraceae bacterium]|nr:DUF4296 domain-containing protein [Saprospiraceae bacterium]